MHGRRLLALSLLAVVFGCHDQKTPTEPLAAKAPPDPSAIISDGAHCGPAGSTPACNTDFFFLPPMVPLPLGNPNFELGKFNNQLKGSLKIEICELKAQNLNAQGLPTAATDCIAGAPKKAFAPGSVNLVNLPLRDHGWWNLFGLPADGFYYVLWDTRQSSLSVNKFYRIKVLLNGSTAPLGVADVDPMNSLREWKFTRTGEVVQLIDDVLLPIPFRVEKGGGPALCGESNLCTSATITNLPEGSPDQIVHVQGADGSFIAGVKIPAGFLPPTGPQSVVITIRGVNTGVNNIADGTQQFPCHANLPLQQFNSCFHFSTIPELAPIPNGEPGHEFDQFLKPITVGVCFVLRGTEFWQEPWVQLWSSEEEGRDAKPLESAPVDQILTGPTGETCGNNLLGSNNINSSNGFTRFASAGWQKVKSGFSRLFGVQTAYAVDFGIGGFAFDLSFIGPAMTARIQPHTSTNLTFNQAGVVTTTSTARIVGSQHHRGGSLNTGIGGLPVTFTVAPGNGSLKLLGSELPGAATVTSITNTNPIDESPTSGGGFAPVNWTMPTPTDAESHTYTLTATGAALGSPVTYTATVTGTVGGNVINFENYPNGSPACGGAASCDVTNDFANVGVVFGFQPLIEVSPTASLCLKPFNPVGESPNYGVSPHALTGCSSWATGTVTMSFAAPPTAVEFELQGNNSLSEGPFPVTALDVTGNTVNVTRTSVVTYSPSTGLTFRREIRRAASGSGIASVAVVSSAGVIFIDKLLITP